MNNILKNKFGRKESFQPNTDIAPVKQPNQNYFKEQFDKFEWRIEQLEEELRKKFDFIDIKVTNFENSYLSFKSDSEEEARKDKLTIKNFQSELKELNISSQKYHRQIMDIAQQLSRY